MPWRRRWFYKRACFTPGYKAKHQNSIIITAWPTDTVDHLPTPAACRTVSTDERHIPNTNALRKVRVINRQGVSDPLPTHSSTHPVTPPPRPDGRIPVEMCARQQTG